MVRISATMDPHFRGDDGKMNGNSVTDDTHYDMTQNTVMAGLDTGIYVSRSYDIVWFQHVNGRIKSGHDDLWL